MNEVLIENWNRVVKPQDHVWHLGDVAMGHGDGHHNQLLQRLNGHKRLVVGNHDKLKSKALHMNFEKIELWRGFKEHGFTCIHIPLPLASLRDGNVCVHGHIHQNILADPHYVNVCVEHTAHTPIHLEEITAIIKNRNL